MRPFLVIVFILLLSTAVQAAAAPAPDEAQRLYQAYGDALYQVQVIDLTSGKKTSIGSGFEFTKDGLIATNYHVVAGALQRPGSNRIEFLNDKGETGPLKVLIADVVHDLAIVKMDKPGKTFLTLGTSKMPKGSKLFSLGNPHDIGFTIIEGTFNGLSKDSFVDNIHFSGALNPGMSGGPAIGHDGAVVGINVATAGNDIGFLVPVEPLQALLARYLKLPPGYNFVDHADAHLQEQLLASQDHNINALLVNKKWESVPFGPVKVPGHIHDVLKCWGGANHKETDPYEDYFSICASQDRIFLDSDGTGADFDTGGILYRYNYIVGKDKLNLTRFYNFYQGQFSIPGGDFQNAKEGDVTNFDCNSRFVDIAGFRWKSNFCIRQYKKYPAIYDMHLYMAMVGDGKKGFIATLAAQGVSKQNALAFARRFMSEIKPGKDFAMKLILEIRHHGNDEDAQHLAFTSFPVSIGRGFDNDVILNDPYISPQHLQIEYDGETCIVSDYGSDNGFTVNALSPSGRRVPVKSGDTLRIGQTEIRVYKPEHPVAAATLLPKDNPIFAWVARPLNVWACFLLAVAVTLCWAWLEIWADEEGLALAGAAAGTVGVIVLWSAIWSVAGRLTHHKAHFKSHIALICLYMIAGTVAWYVEVYIDFLTNENWFSQIATYGINFVLLGFLLYASLKLATRMHRKRRMVSAAFFSFGVMAGVFIFSIVSAKTFNQQPIYPATLEPYLSQLAPADTVDQFMAGNDKLFKSDEFAQPVAVKKP